MSRVGAALRPGLPQLPAGLAGSAGAALMALGLVAFSSFIIVVGIEWLRLLVALAFALLLVSLTLARPTAGILTTVGFLTFLAFLRRILIADAGWWPLDPLLLVGPLVAFLLVVKLFVLERRPLATDLISKGVLLVAALYCVQVVNPVGGGPLAGLGGLLFTLVPLMWFFIGRELLTDAVTDRLLVVIIALGTVVAAYGFFQTEAGLPSWDKAWLAVGGYVSLTVGDEVRAFGTFSSSAEYALFLGTALAVAFAYVLRGRAWALLGIPMVALSLFLASGRGALVTAFLAIVLILALRTRRPATALVVSLVALLAAFGGLQAFGSQLNRAGDNSGSDLVSHQVGGITDPLDPDSSTLLIHIELLWDGIKTGVREPLGRGTGSTNSGGKLAGGKGESKATEVDISNSFVALGLAGGLLYVALVGLVLTRSVRMCFAAHPLSLPVFGVVMVGLGQWLTGGHYALAPITWLMIGWVAARSASLPKSKGQPA